MLAKNASLLSHAAAVISTDMFDTFNLGVSSLRPYCRVALTLMLVLILADRAAG
jgi:hypothetical protein